jgi:hypothetical protein
LLLTVGDAWFSGRLLSTTVISSRTISAIIISSVAAA